MEKQNDKSYPKLNRIILKNSDKVEYDIKFMQMLNERITGIEDSVKYVMDGMKKSSYDYDCLSQLLGSCYDFKEEIKDRNKVNLVQLFTELFCKTDNTSGEVDNS